MTASATQFAQLYPISDLCFLVADVERAIAFYVGKLGFKLRRRAPGFADFKGAGLTLALWEIGHISRHAGVSGSRAEPRVHKACAAVEVASPRAVDELYRDLGAAGVRFEGAARGLSVERPLLLLRRSGRQSVGDLCLAGRGAGRGRRQGWLSRSRGMRS